MPPDWLMSISWHDWHREWFLFFHFSLEEAIPCSICSMVEKHKTCQPMLTTHQQKDVGNSPFIWVQADCIVVTKGHHFSTTKQKHISGTTSALGKMAECLPRSIKDMITLANDKPLRFAFTTVSRRSKLNWNINNGLATVVWRVHDVKELNIAKKCQNFNIRQSDSAHDQHVA